MTTVSTRGLKLTSLYKILFIGLFIPVFCFGMACGIASFLGHSTVSWNGQYVYGVQGLIGGIVIGVFIPVVLSLFLSLIMGLSIWIWTRVRRIDITYKI